MGREVAGDGPGKRFPGKGHVWKGFQGETGLYPLSSTLWHCTSEAPSSCSSGLQISKVQEFEGFGV